MPFPYARLRLSCMMLTLCLWNLDDSMFGDIGVCLNDKCLNDTGKMTKAWCGYHQWSWWGSSQWFVCALCVFILTYLVLQEGDVYLFIYRTVSTRSVEGNCLWWHWCMMTHLLCNLLWNLPWCLCGTLKGWWYQQLMKMILDMSWWWQWSMMGWYQAPTKHQSWKWHFQAIVDAPQVVCPLALGHSEHGSKVTQTYVAEGTSGFLLGKGVFSGNTTINEWLDWLNEWNNAMEQCMIHDMNGNNDYMPCNQLRKDL